MPDFVHPRDTVYFFSIFILKVKGFCPGVFFPDGGYVQRGFCPRGLWPVGAMSTCHCGQTVIYFPVVIDCTINGY